MTTFGIKFARTVIAFAVQEDQPSILGVFYGDQDYETALAGQAV
jgi:hypothetical protein